MIEPLPTDVSHNRLLCARTAAMNALDAKILEAAGWKKPEGEPPVGAYWKAPPITLDMLVEVACKVGQPLWKATAPKNHKCSIAGFDGVEVDSGYRSTFSEATRAALAAHWVIEDK